MFNDDGHIEQLEREIDGLKTEIMQLKWLLRCKENSALCPCGGVKGVDTSHALDCIEICDTGRDYGVLV